MAGKSGNTGLQDMKGIHGSGLMGNSNLLLSETDLNDDSELTAFIEVSIEDMRRRRLGLERSWYQSIEFFQGNHWVRWDPVEQRWTVEYRLPHKVRYIGNLISTYVTTRISKLLKNRPYLHTNPSTNEPSDIETAALSTRVLRAEWERMKVNAKVLPAWINDVILMGTGFLKVYFDHDGGELIEFSDEDAELVGEEKGWSQRTGQVAVEAVSPYWLYPDPTAERFDECRYVIDVRRKTLDEIRSDFEPSKTEKVSSADTFRTQDFYRARIRGYAGGTANQGYDQRTIPSSLVKEIWVKPSRAYPKGYHAIISGGQVLFREEELPVWCDGRIPYIALLDKEIPYRLWGAAVLEDIRDIVKVRNRVMSQIIDNANVIGNPPIRIPSGAKLGAEDITGKPGAKWFYMPGQSGHKPEFVDVPTLPDYVKSLPDRLEDDVMAITGMNETTFRAEAPANVRTASGLAALMRQDDSRQAVFIERMNGALTEVGDLILRVVASEYKEERIARVIGEKDKLTVQTFKGQDILGEQVDVPGANYFDVEIRVDSGHRSKEAQQQYLISLAQTGLVDISSQAERHWLLRQLDVGAPDDELFGNITSVESQAHTENNWLATLPDEHILKDEFRMVLGPHSWDDHETHMRVHQEYMRRTDFLKLEQDIWIRFLQHINAHEAMLQEESMLQLQDQQELAMAGAPQEGAPGEPPAPGDMGQEPPPRPAGGPPADSIGGLASQPGQAVEADEAQPPDLQNSVFQGVA